VIDALGFTVPMRLKSVQVIPQAPVKDAGAGARPSGESGYAAIAWARAASSRVMGIVDAFAVAIGDGRSRSGSTGAWFRARPKKSLMLPLTATMDGGSTFFAVLWVAG